LRGAAAGLSLFLAQLVLNALWSYLFFGLHRPDVALVEILILWIVIVVVVLAFWRTVRLAGALLVPYLLWVGFASYLNFELWRLNPVTAG
jgi:tryptophan-rich sensory protein